MRQSLRQMLVCRWSARRIQRYLDADPSALLTPGEIAKIESHLARCEKCTQTAEEHRALHRALSQWPGRQAPDAEAIARLRSFVDQLAEDEQP